MVIIKVFLSYKWEDKIFTDGLRGTFLNPNNEYRHVPSIEREDYRKKSIEAKKSYLRGLITDCQALICVIGQNTHSSEWVAYELEVATSQDKKIVPIRIRDTTGGAPKLIRERNLEIISWDSRLINNELSK